MSERDPLREVEEALSFPVSADFCARVRQQVAGEPVRMRMFGVRYLALAAAVLLAVATGFITTFRDASVGVAPVIPRLGVTTRASARVEREPVASIEPVRVRQQPVSMAARGTVTPFETVVPDDQLRALDSLLASMRAGTATVPPVVADDEVNDCGERVLRALVIEPVTIELLAGTPAEPIKNPVKTPNK